MAENKSGDMDVEAHERTFHGFVRFMTWASVVILLLLVFLAIVGA